MMEWVALSAGRCGSECVEYSKIVVKCAILQNKCKNTQNKLFLVKNKSIIVVEGLLC